MQEITFSLRTVTPLFLAGANQSAAELRAPSFRGLMRYWYRALVGGLVGTDEADLEQVVEAEKNLFGATDKGSAISLRISHEESMRTIRLLREGNTKASATGKDYLFWSTFQRRPCIPEMTPFRVTITARHIDKTREELVFKQGISAFWLLTHLGGLGTRSRRCAGNLAVENIEEIYGLPFFMPTSIEELQNQLREGIATSRQFYGDVSDTTVNNPSFDILNQNFCKIWILLNNGNTWNTTDQAIRDIGHRLRAYRDTVDIHKRKYFGIPVMVLEGGRAKPLRISGAGSFDATGKVLKRLASPLHIRIAEIKVGQEIRYVGLATLFKTKWADMTDRDYKEYVLVEKWITEKFADAARTVL